MSTSHVSNHFIVFHQSVFKASLFRRISLLTNSSPQITTTGSCSGPPSSRHLALSARASLLCVLSSRAYHPSPSFVPSAARSVFPPCALTKVPLKVLPMRPVTPDPRAIRTRGLRTLLNWRMVPLPSVMASPVWNWRTGTKWRRLGMVSGVTSTSTERSISALRKWCDGSDRSVGCTCVKTIIIKTRKRLRWSGNGGWKCALTLGEEQSQ